MILASLVLLLGAAQDPPPGFVSLLGDDLSGWKGLVANPEKRPSMEPDAIADAQAQADAEVAKHWRVEDGVLTTDGHGPHLCTSSDYADFELRIDWKIAPGADSGIYLRGSPQVQIWDPGNGQGQTNVGSGGLYNNKIHESRPLVVADETAGEWNRFVIRMIGEHVTVDLNDERVVDDVVFENYWSRSRPIYPRGQVELQTHGGEVTFRNIFLREITSEESISWLESRDAEGFVPLLNGRDLEGWQGSLDGYIVEDGSLVCTKDRGGNLLTVQEYSDFRLRFRFRLEPGGNNGLAVRAPARGNPAYEGLEIQILDNDAPQYANLELWQYHGSIYGLVPAQRGYLHPAGEWNFEEVLVDGGHVRVAVNGTTITDGDLEAIETPMDGAAHPGLDRREGHIGFMGHGARVEIRDLVIHDLSTASHGG